MAALISILPVAAARPRRRKPPRPMPGIVKRDARVTLARLGRLGGMTYRSIAEVLDVSERSVYFWCEPADQPGPN